MKKTVLLFSLVILGLTTVNSFAVPPTGPSGSTPDGGSTALMLAAGMGGLAWVWKRARR